MLSDLPGCKPSGEDSEKQMIVNQRNAIFFVILIIFHGMILTACNLSFAEDITPPPGYQPSEYLSQADSEPEIQYPLVSPNPANGSQIYAEKCAPCHGDRGLGDGPQADDLSVPPTAIGTAEISRQVKPVEWYEIVTVGNLDRFMPPFTSLTDRQRWDVIAYVFTLGLTDEELNAAANLYLQQCAQCHGETALGDGSAAADLSTRAADFTDQEKMSNLSAQDLFDAIYQGIEPAMPGYAEGISDADIWALTSYLRAITFQPPYLAEEEARTDAADTEAMVEADVTTDDEVESGATVADSQTEAIPVAENPPGFGTIQGQVVNGSGEEIDSDLIITLHGYDHGESDFVEVLTVETSVNPDGSYAFTDVEFVNGRLFLLTVDYGRATYGSDIISADPENPIVEIPLVYYETTTDTSTLKAERLHIFFEVIPGDMIRISQLYIVANTGFEAIITNEANDPVIAFRVPEEAANLTFDDGTLGDRFVLVPGGFGDRRGVLPGSNAEILYSYDMPYDSDLKLDISVPIPIEAVIAMLPDMGLRLKSPILLSAGTREAEGYAYQIYTAGSLSAGSVLPIDISGRINFGESVFNETNQIGFIVGVSALGLVLIALLVWWLRRTGRVFSPVHIDFPSQLDSDSEEELPEQIMDAIIAIDDLYAAGRLPEEAYRKRRAELKEKLARLIE